MERFDDGWIVPTSAVGYTPFQLAAKYLEVESMRALLAAGADPTVVATDGTTSLMAAAGVGRGGNGATDRRNRTVDVEIVKAEHDDEGRVLEAVKVVVDAGIDVNATNRTGDTALHGAASNHYKNVLQYLVERGGKLDVKNKAGATPSDLLARGVTTEE